MKSDEVRVALCDWLNEQYAAMMPRALASVGPTQAKPDRWSIWCTIYDPNAKGCVYLYVYNEHDQSHNSFEPDYVLDLLNPRCFDELKAQIAEAYQRSRTKPDGAVNFIVDAKL